MSALFIWSGFGKLVAAAGTKAYCASLGVPLPELAWLVAVVVELLGGLALLLGVQARLTALVLGVWCLATALAGHLNFADPNMRIHFMKNVAMAGGFTFISVFGAGISRASACPLQTRAFSLLIGVFPVALRIFTVTEGLSGRVRPVLGRFGP